MLDDWLTYRGSLTNKLKATCGDATLQRLSHVWSTVNFWEEKNYSLPQGSRLIRREIVMLAHGKPCWYARTMIPKTTYVADPEFFLRLQNQSLNNLIHDSSRVKRVSLEHKQLNKEDVEYTWLGSLKPNNQEALWIRYSEQRLDNEYPFYLVEILLPMLWVYVYAKP